ncbi:hypothetical protein C1645_819191 [Glomus cerebriforme]|uniref:Uncharacterized protein n=1 Tax=Glomus cerebriforme TaxID=658196 RepID=A0A397TBC4_9GLOM|nr:hypothetical protein C1645_819191 [Glomus cerebriforme]
MNDSSNYNIPEGMKQDIDSQRNGQYSYSQPQIFINNNIYNYQQVIIHEESPPPYNNDEKSQNIMIFQEIAISRPIPGQVDYSILPTDRILTQLTSLEQVWNMPLIHNYKPTWKFWFIIVFLLYLIFWSFIIGLSIIISDESNDNNCNDNITDCKGLEQCLIDGCFKCSSECVKGNASSW